MCVVRSVRYTPVDKALDQVDIFVISVGQADLWSDISQVEASGGQEGYYFRSACHLVSLWVRLTFGQMSPLRVI